jgi:hypothetical protein
MRRRALALQPWERGTGARRAVHGSGPQSAVSVTLDAREQPAHTIYLASRLPSGGVTK